VGRKSGTYECATPTTCDCPIHLALYRARAELFPTDMRARCGGLLLLGTFSRLKRSNYACRETERVRRYVTFPTDPSISPPEVELEDEVRTGVAHRDTFCFAEKGTNNHQIGFFTPSIHFGRFAHLIAYQVALTPLEKISKPLAAGGRRRLRRERAQCELRQAYITQLWPLTRDPDREQRFRRLSLNVEARFEHPRLAH